MGNVNAGFIEEYPWMFPAEKFKKGGMRTALFRSYSANLPNIFDYFMFEKDCFPIPSRSSVTFL